MGNQSNSHEYHPENCELNYNLWVRYTAFSNRDVYTLITKVKLTISLVLNINLILKASMDFKNSQPLQDYLGQRWMSIILITLMNTIIRNIKVLVPNMLIKPSLGKIYLIDNITITKYLTQSRNNNHHPG